MAKMKFLVLLIVLISRGDGLMFNLEANSRKCLKEEIHKGVLVTGDYDISSHPGQVRKFVHNRSMIYQPTLARKSRKSINPL